MNPPKPTRVYETLSDAWNALYKKEGSLEAFLEDHGQKDGRVHPYYKHARVLYTEDDTRYYEQSRRWQDEFPEDWAAYYRRHVFPDTMERDQLHIQCIWEIMHPEVSFKDFVFQCAMDMGEHPIKEGEVFMPRHIPFRFEIHPFQVALIVLTASSYQRLVETTIIPRNSDR